MISLKKYLDLDRSGLTTVEPEANELSAATMDSFRAVLLAIGKCAVQVAPGLGVDLETSLRGFERRLSVNYSPDSVKNTEKQVEVQLQEWSTRTSEHFRARADEVKEFYDQMVAADPKTPPFEQTRDQMEKLLIEQRITQTLERWLGTQRNQIEILYREPAFK